jgi:hypothetical protein
MDQTHPLDRLALRIRPAIIVTAALCAPAFLISYAFLWRDAWYAWPGWIFAIALIAHVVGWLGISALFDTRQSRQMQTGTERF